MSAHGGASPAANAPREQSSFHWLWLLVAFQVLVPASYYVRGERSDERFAWRMFSAVRVERCKVRASVFDAGGERERIELEHTLHSGWITGLERGRKRVIERFLSRLCTDRASQESELKRSCEDAVGGRRLERFRMQCASQRMSHEVQK